MLLVLLLATPVFRGGDAFAPALLIFNWLVNSLLMAKWLAVGLRWPARELIDSADLLAFLEPDHLGAAFRSSAVVVTYLIFFISDLHVSFE